MIKLFASHPAYKQLIFLPNPEFGDIARLESTVQLKRSMDGSVIVTHTMPRTESRTLELQFEMTRLKSLEFIEFYKLHAAEKMKLVKRIDFDPENDEESFIGYLKVNPLELEKLARSVYGDSVEKVAVRVDFETVSEDVPENDGAFRLNGPTTATGSVTLTWHNLPVGATSLTMYIQWGAPSGSDSDVLTLDQESYEYSSLIPSRTYEFTLGVEHPDGDFESNSVILTT